mmetsp:Transcript_27055/g.51520  ORF Transcript_27055/g.51520 Transcript_27055/m.51520 type:complete len:212 (-) Transcript_27055:337-972(-)
MELITRLLERSLPCFQNAVCLARNASARSSTCCSRAHSSSSRRASSCSLNLAFLEVRGEGTEAEEAAAEVVVVLRGREDDDEGAAASLAVEALRLAASRSRSWCSSSASDSQPRLPAGTSEQYPDTSASREFVFSFLEVLGRLLSKCRPWRHRRSLSCLWTARTTAVTSLRSLRATMHRSLPSTDEALTSAGAGNVLAVAMDSSDKTTRFR